ncbi:MAG: hypothetical protein LC792_00920 [Actinobacteria bacterium]|nr:hypothetical protein [Actinomycetota bacterium]
MAGDIEVDVDIGSFVWAAEPNPTTGLHRGGIVVDSAVAADGTPYFLVLTDDRYGPVVSIRTQGRHGRSVRTVREQRLAADVLDPTLIEPVVPRKAATWARKAYLTVGAGSGYLGGDERDLLRAAAELLGVSER